MKLLIIGAGSFSTEVEETARLLGYDEIGFLDDHPEKSISKPVVGSFSDLTVLKNQYENAIVALGNNSGRMKYTKQLEDAGYTIPVLIHPTAYVSPDAVIEKGCIVRAMSVVGRYAVISKASILNIGAKVDHHCIIGEGSHLQINSVVRNSQKVEPYTWLDAGCIIQ